MDGFPSRSNADPSYSSRPTIIITFAKKKTLDRILLKRRSLKGSHVGLAEDLTLPNSSFIAMCRKYTRVKNIWSSDGNFT